MNYNTHKLNSQNHSHIIGRQYSVTGDAIKANDEVVFCSVCQSVFLKESWEYMNEIYCNQTETLGFIPVQEKEIKARKKDALIFEVLPNTREYKISFTIFSSIGFFATCGIFYILLSKFSLEDIQTQNGITEIVVLLIFNLLFLFIMYMTILHEKKKFNIGTIPLKIYEDTIISFDKVYDWKDVEFMEHTSHSKFHKQYVPNQLRINLKNEVLDIDLPSKHPRNSEFLVKLMSLSSSIKITFYTKNKKELKFLNEQKKELNKNIVLIKETMFLS